MKRILNKIGALLMLALLIVSCSEIELLEPKPLSFYTPENVYNEPGGFEATLVKMRKNLTIPITGGNRYEMIAEWGYSEGGSLAFLFDLTTVNPFAVQFYPMLEFLPKSYGFIKEANIVINRIDDIEWNDEQQKNTILAEAYWHRSYWYYWLVHTYGDIPYVSQEISAPKLDYVTNTRESILDKLEEDMEFAVANLPESAVPGAITRGAGNHLLTKIYIANLEFDKAIEAASRVINGPYSLMTQRFGQDADDTHRNVIWDLHRPDNKNRSENTENLLSIVDRFEAPAGAQSSGTATMRHYNCSWWHSRVKDSDGIQGTLDSGPMYDTLGRGNPDVVLTPYIFYDVWNEEDFTWRTTPDLRRSDINWVDKHEFLYNNPSSSDFGKVIDPKLVVPQQDSIWLIYPIPHYKTFVPQKDPNARPFGGNGDWYIYRLAETYLLRAEAYFWKDQFAAAANDINMVRERADAPPVTADKITIDYIFDERARELFIETPRHAEMVRVSYIMANLNINGYNLNDFSQNNWWYDRTSNNNPFYQMNAEKYGMVARVSPHNVLWPIDNNVITANTLGQINQNEGYAGAENNIPPMDIVDEEQQ